MNDSHFFSVDRLIEFGMGMSIAQQMISSMNYSMHNMAMPGVDPPKKSTAISDQVYYAIIRDKQVGPLSTNDLMAFINQKEIVNETYMWTPSMTGWKMAEQIPEVVKLVAITPPPFKNESL